MRFRIVPTKKSIRLIFQTARCAGACSNPVEIKARIGLMAGLVMEALKTKSDPTADSLCLDSV